MKSYTIAAILLLSQCNGQILKCGELSNNECFRHSGTDPVEYIVLGECKDGEQVCFIEGEEAWVDARRQYRKLPRTEYQYQGKSLRGTCRDPKQIGTNLLPGRICFSDSQCLSSTCRSIDHKCGGKAFNEPCAHSQECTVGLACIASAKWPFETLCRQLLSQGQSCENEFECQHGLTCSGGKCLTKYRIEDGVTIPYSQHSAEVKGDILWAGLRCISGLCIPQSPSTCLCVSIANITSDYQPPYCYAQSQPSFCIYNYLSTSQTLQTFKLPCQLSIANTDIPGFCELPSQSVISKYIEQQLVLQSYASGCHSMDRFNIEAQIECGIGRVLSEVQVREILENINKVEMVQEGQGCMGRHPRSVESRVKRMRIIRNVEI